MDILSIAKSVFATVFGLIAHWLGGLDNLLAALIALIVIDYITGVIKAYINRTLSSNEGLRGIAKKVMSLSVVALAFILGGLISDAVPLREITIMFFVANEGLSILENAGQIGLPLPQKLRSALEGLRGKADNEDKKTDVDNLK